MLQEEEEELLAFIIRKLFIFLANVDKFVVAIILSVDCINDSNWIDIKITDPIWILSKCWYHSLPPFLLNVYLLVFFLFFVFQIYTIESKHIWS